MKKINYYGYETREIFFISNQPIEIEFGCVQREFKVAIFWICLLRVITNFKYS